MYLVAGGFFFLGGIVGLLLSSRRGGFRVAGWVGWRTTTGQQQQDRLFRNTYGRVAWERLVVVVFRTAVRATFGRRDGTGGQSSTRETGQAWVLSWGGRRERRVSKTRACEGGRGTVRVL